MMSRATAQQVKCIEALVAEAEDGDEALADALDDAQVGEVEDLTREQASELIDTLQLSR